MTTASELSCKQFIELVTDYLEGRLPKATRQRFEQHLADCDDCPIYLEQMQHTIRMTGALTPESLSPQARDALLHAFRNWNAR